MFNFFKRKPAKVNRPTYTVMHEKLGTFTGGFFPEEGFISNVDLNGLKFEIEIMCKTPQDFEKFRPYLEQISNNFENIYNSAQNCAVIHLLDLKNSKWPDEDGNVVTGEQFRDRMDIGQFIVFENRDIEIWFHGEKLFKYHIMKVRGTIDKGWNTANLFG